MKKLRPLMFKIALMALTLFSVNASTSFAYPTYGIAFGYVPGYSSSTGSYAMSVTDVPFGDLSHVSFFVALVNGTSVSLDDPLALSGSLVSHAHAATPKVRCYLTIGGANGNTWPTTTANCQTLADNIVALATANGFDGVDIDCEFPGDSGYPATAAFTALMARLKTDCGSATPGMVPSGRYSAESNFGLTMYLSPGYDVCGYNFSSLNSDVDWYTFSGYDLNIGASIAYQGSLVCPGTESFTNCSSTAMLRDLTAVSNFYNTTGVGGTIPYNKMVLGMPLYGRDNVTPSNTGKSDNDVFLNGSGGTYDTSRCEVPWTDGGNTYGMDNAQSFCDKINWAVGQKGMLGIALFDLGQGLQSGAGGGTFSNSTLQGIWNAISGSSACVTVGTNPCAPLTCSPTPTYTGTPSCGKLIENFEAGLPSTSAENDLGGYWSTYLPTGSSLTYTNTSGDGLNGSVYGGRLVGATAAAGSPSFNGGLATSGTYNASTLSETGLQFSVRVDKWAASEPATILVYLQMTNASGPVYAATAVVPQTSIGNGTFQSGTSYNATLFFSQFVYQTWSAAGAFDPTKLYLLSYIAYPGASPFNFDYTLDDMYFACPPTPTNTPTSTATFTFTPTPTVANTNTSTVTNTATNTVTETATATATNTSTATLSNTFTSTASYTFTPTITNTPTLTDTATITNTPTITPTPTATDTGTLGPTSTFTLTLTNTPTFTFTVSPTITNTPTITDTPAGPTNTPTTTFTTTPTYTPSYTGTWTPTDTSTITNTPNGPTATFTNTFTVTDTPTSTATATLTFSSTVTNTPTLPFTATNTFTSTNTQTPTLTPTITNTQTQTSTPTMTATATATALNHDIFSPPFPNPATTGPVQINVTTPGAASIQMDVFTVAFRKIAEHSFSASATGPQGTLTAVQWDLHDRMGLPVADGLYYVRIHVTGGQESVKIFKVLVLR